MKSILVVVFCCVTYGVKAQAPNAVFTVPGQPSNWEEFSSSHQAFKETTKAKSDKFSCVLNLLKNALSEELENSHFQITPETTRESVLSSINCILEEEQMKKEFEGDIEKQGVDCDDEDKTLYQKIITKIASAFSKPNVTNNVEIPTTIPIFKPRQLSRNELNQNVPDFNPINRQVPKSKAISFVPERIIQTSVNPILNAPVFNIPCQKASDVLDMTNIVPKEVRRSNVKTKVNPIAEVKKPNLPPPVTLSVDSADSDDTVAMLFKPKNISLKQIYGNLLKKITVTVLVPYHMSKLGDK